NQSLMPYYFLSCDLGEAATRGSNCGSASIMEYNQFLMVLHI
ncbi:uncharacterized protein METZ01_LOCUS203148, partial [marine metagenome]